jgi:hypothetical protein
LLEIDRTYFLQFRPRSAKDAYHKVKAKELEMSLNILAIRKGMEEEEEAKFQQQMLSTELEDQQLQVKERKLNMLLIQASLRVQLLTEKKLMCELEEAEKGKKLAEEE